MKLARVVDTNVHSALDKLASQQLPIKTAFKLKGIAKIVREEFNKYTEVRNASLQKFGKKNDKGELVVEGEQQTVQFEGDDLTLFVKEINDLVNEEIDMPTIKLSELGDKLTMSLAEIELLEGFIVEE